MREVLLDFETDSLEPTKIHCIHAADINTRDETHFVAPENLETLREFANKIAGWSEVKLLPISSFLDFIKDIDIMYGHNFIDFDLRKVIEKFFNVKIPLGKIRDTYIASKLAYSDRGQKDAFDYTKKGQKLPKVLSQKPHSLEAFGVRVGYGKPFIEDWTNWDVAKSDRCRDDVIINIKAWKHIIKPELSGFSQYSLKLEQKTAYIISQMRDNGFALNYDFCKDLFVEVSEMEKNYEEALVKAIPQRKVYKSPKHMNWTPRISKSGKMHSVDERLLSEYQKEVNPDGTFNLFNYADFNPRSSVQILEVLNESGWNPIVFKKPSKTQKAKGWKRGNPEITNEDNLATIPKDAPEEIHLIPKFLSIKHKRELTEEWLRLYEESPDGRIRGYVDSLGTPTARMRHNSPNMANISKVLKDKEGSILWKEDGKYGWEMRNCWSVSDKENNRLVGIDASGLELRMLCHFMNDPEYTNTVLTGDIHTMNQEAAGLPTRDMAKTFIYALLYGAGDAKIGRIVEGTANDGRALKEKFFRNIPALGNLVRQVQHQAEQGWIWGLDGRKLIIRHQHAALNTLLQSAGAITMKQALIMATKWLNDEDVWFLHVNNVHDEFQIETRKDTADYVGSKGVEAIVKAGEFFKMNIPLDGEYKVGLTWAETH